MRLFAALCLPEKVAEHLETAVRSVDATAPTRSAGPGRPALRWVPALQRHITLAFYGEVPSGAVEALTEDLEEVLAGVVPFSVRVRGAGVFAGRTMWVGVQETGRGALASEGSHSRGATPLTDLMGVAETVGARHARTPEVAGERGRRRAHVTLARARDRRRGEAELRARAEALAVYEGPAWTVMRAHLMLSELGQGRSGGPQHTELAQLPLRHQPQAAGSG